MTFDDHTATITRIVQLQNSILDHSGHVIRGTPRVSLRATVDEIQRLRESVGWEPLDMTGRYRRR